MALNTDEAEAVIRQTRRFAGQAEQVFDNLASLSAGEIARMVEPTLRFKEKVEFAVEELKAALEQVQKERPY